jgi:TubC N-terminal docking domain
MSAVTLIREAAKSRVWVGLNGGNLVLKAPAKPPDALLAKLKANKAEIVALLRQAACAVRPGGIFRYRMASRHRRCQAARPH